MIFLSMLTSILFSKWNDDIQEFYELIARPWFSKNDSQRQRINWNPLKLSIHLSKSSRVYHSEEWAGAQSWCLDGRVAANDIKTAVAFCASKLLVFAEYSREAWAPGALIKARSLAKEKLSPGSNVAM